MGSGGRPAITKEIWLVMAIRLVTTFATSVASLAYLYVAMNFVGGVVPSVIVVSASAIGFLLGNFLGGLSDLVNPAASLLIASLLGVTVSLFVSVAALSSFWQLAVFVAGSGLTSVFLASSARAESSAVVIATPTEDLPKVFGVLAARAQIVVAFAGLVSGALIVWSVMAPFILDTLAWSIAGVLAITLYRRRKILERQEVPESVSFVALFRGYSFVVGNKYVLGIVLISTFANLFLEGAGAVIEIDLLRQEVNPVLVGWIGAGTGAAGLIGSVLSGKIADRFGTRFLFVAVLTTMALAFLLIAAMGSYVVTLISLCTAVFLLPSLGVSAATGIARRTPQGLQARVSGTTAVLSLISSSVSPGAFGGLYAATSRLLSLSVISGGVFVAAVLARFSLPDD